MYKRKVLDFFFFVKGMIDLVNMEFWKEKGKNEKYNLIISKQKEKFDISKIDLDIFLYIIIFDRDLKFCFYIINIIEF